MRTSSSMGTELTRAPLTYMPLRLRWSTAIH